MKIFLNFIGLTGFGLIAAGVFLQWGLAPALMTAGTLALVFSLKALSVTKGA